MFIPAGADTVHFFHLTDLIDGVNTVVNHIPVILRPGRTVPAQLGGRVKLDIKRSPFRFGKELVVYFLFPLRKYRQQCCLDVIEPHGFGVRVCRSVKLRQFMRRHAIHFSHFRYAEFLCIKELRLIKLHTELMKVQPDIKNGDFSRIIAAAIQLLPLFPDALLCLAVKLCRCFQYPA